MNPVEAVRSFVSQYFIFNGRARRSELWWTMLAILVAGLVVGTVEALLGTGEVLSDLLTLAVAIPALALGSRRLHDIGKSGWWQLLYVIPVVGWILFVVWGSTDSQRENRFGPSPKAVSGRQVWSG